MNRYVVGLMFSLDKSKVLLIEKQRPYWQKDKLNGIGGKKDRNDFNDFHTISCKFKKETGVETKVEDWSKIITLENSESESIIFFKCFSDKIYEAKTITDERVVILNLVNAKGEISINELQNTINNIPWIILLAFDTEVYKVEGHTTTS